MIALEPCTSIPLGHLAERRLRDNPYHALQRVSCDCLDGVVILRGRVPSYFLKQMATAAVSDLPGLHHVVNEIDVGMQSRTTKSLTIRSPPMNEPRPVNVQDWDEQFSRLSQDVEELNVLLPRWWIAALEEAACERGQTAGQLVRSLIRNLVTR